MPHFHLILLNPIVTNIRILSSRPKDAGYVAVFTHKHLCNFCVWKFILSLTIILIFATLKILKYEHF